MENKKSIIIASFSIGTIALSTATAVPLILTSDSNNNKNISKFDKLKLKIEKYNLSKVIKLSGTNDVNISSSKNKTKIVIINAINSVNKENELTTEEKNAITIQTPTGAITHTTFS